MDKTAPRISITDIRQAYERIKADVIRTPCVPSKTLSRLTGANVYLKFENLQFTGSFKERGALNKLLSLSDEERARGVVAMSAGNHAQAVAFHAQRLGIPAVIVMPRQTPTTKVEHTRGFGAEVILRGETIDEGAKYVEQLIRERRLVLVHPYDDPAVIAGQGTIALEMLESQPGLETLVVPIGGGGLISGNAIAARSIRENIELVGVETTRFPSMKQALAGETVHCGSYSLADGIAVKQPGKLTQPIVAGLVSEILLVDESEIEQAVLTLLEVEKTVVEGAGGVGLAAMLQHPETFSGRNVGVIVSGGNIDMPVLSTIIERGLVESGRVGRLRLSVRDVPGKLGDAVTLIEERGANIVQIEQQRTFTGLQAQMVQVELIVQVRGPDHLAELEQGLREAGVTLVEVGAGKSFPGPARGVP
ncbi:MAG TPA: threonine ammonia-lyase [Arenicellales bacterium]|nr:threonine ammonia-lyase [Arenicellales bacterium]